MSVGAQGWAGEDKIDFGVLLEWSDPIARVIIFLGGIKC